MPAMSSGCTTSARGRGEGRQGTWARRLDRDVARGRLDRRRRRRRPRARPRRRAAGRPRRVRRRRRGGRRGPRGRSGTLLRAVEDVTGQGVGREVVLATNTSSLSITAIAAALRGPGLLVGLHFFNPAPPHVARRGGPRRRDRPEGRRHGGRAGPRLGQDARPLLVDAGLCGQPGRAPLLRRGVSGSRSRRRHAATITRPARGRAGSRWACQLTDFVGQDVNLAVARRCGSRQHDPRYAPTPLPAGAGGGRPARPQDRPGVYDVYRRRAHAGRRPAGRAAAPCAGSSSSSSSTTSAR